MNATEIKNKLKKDLGISKSLIKVKTERSFLYITIKSYEIIKSKIQESLKELNTCKNVSYDLDPIYEGTKLVIKYDAELTDKFKVEIYKTALDMPEPFNIFSIEKVHRLADQLNRFSNTFKNYSIYEIKEMIHKAF